MRGREEVRGGSEDGGSEEGRRVRAVKGSDEVVKHIEVRERNVGERKR